MAALLFASPVSIQAQDGQAATAMAKAATQFVKSLDDAHKAKATYYEKSMLWI